jgi:hypothetical protein
MKKLQIQMNGRSDEFRERFNRIVMGTGEEE